MNTKTNPCETKVFNVGKTHVNFVKVDKGASWLFKAACGDKAQKWSLRRSKTVETLRSKCNDRSAEYCVDVVADEAVDDEDPMNQLDAISSLHADDREAKRLDSKKPRVWVPKRENLRARVFEMPLLPLGHDKGEVHYAMVIPASTSSLWLRDTDVPWLVASAADEVWK